jgi:PKD repeat protein
VDGSGSSDGDGAVTGWSWDWGDGSGPGIGATAAHVYSATGTYIVTLTVTDNLGATSSASRTITCISAGNIPPVAVIQSAVPSVANPPAHVTFTGAGHDDTGPLEHRWDFGDGSPPVVFPNVPNHAITTPTHDYADVGTYVVRLRVMDPERVYSINQTTYLVTPAPSSDGGGGGGGCGATGLEALLGVAWLRCRRRTRRSRA